MSGIGNHALEMMRHAVAGGHRNYYCAEFGLKDWGIWCNLVALKLATAGKIINCGRDQYFHISKAGMDYLDKIQRERNDT